MGLHVTATITDKNDLVDNTQPMKLSFVLGTGMACNNIF